MKKLKSLSILFVIVFIASSFTSTTKVSSSEKSVEWISFEEAVLRSKKEKRKIYIDLYTDWCGWCKKMDRETFTDPDVIKLLNKKYYAVKFNAEQKEAIQFRDKNFTFSTQYRTHELALSLTDGGSGYPTSVILDENFNERLLKQPGYQNAAMMAKILTFFGDDIYKDKSWEDFSAAK